MATEVNKRHVEHMSSSALCRLSSASAWCSTSCTELRLSLTRPSPPARWSWSRLTWTAPPPIMAASPTAARGRRPAAGTALMWCERQSAHEAVSSCEKNDCRAWETRWVWTCLKHVARMVFNRRLCILTLAEYLFNRYRVSARDHAPLNIRCWWKRFCCFSLWEVLVFFVFCKNDFH